MEEKTNTIGKEFTMPQLVKFVAAPIVSRLFISLLGTLDDGLFISRYCGEYALAAFSICMPWFMIIDAACMLFTASGTKCSMLMGEKKNEEANRSFTSICIIAACAGLSLTLILSLFREEIITFMGASEVTLPYAMQYTSISRFYTPMIILSGVFQRFYVIAGKPKMAVVSTVSSTIMNFFFDWLFICRMRTGLVGTAYANLISNSVITIMAIIFFLNKKREIHFGKPLSNPWPFLKDTIRLGSSSALTSLALSVNNYINNIVLLNYGGDLMIAASTVVGNIQFTFMNGLFGMTGAVSPIVSYAYGEKNVKKLSRIIKQFTQITLGLSITLTCLFLLTKKPSIALYLMNSTEPRIRSLVEYGMLSAPYVFLFFGFNIMVQEVALAVDNTKISTILSTLENIILSNLTTILLPYLFGVDALWYSFIVTEAITLIFSLYFVNKYKDAYGYGRSGKATAIENK